MADALTELNAAYRGPEIGTRRGGRRLGRRLYGRANTRGRGRRFVTVAERKRLLGLRENRPQQTVELER